MFAELDLAMAAAEHHATLPDGRGGGLTVTAKIDALVVRADISPRTEFRRRESQAGVGVW